MSALPQDSRSGAWPQQGPDDVDVVDTAGFRLQFRSARATLTRAR
jgi:hypothetical protein